MQNHIQVNSYQILLDNIKKKHHLTNDDISNKAGIPKATVDKITSGKTKHIQDKTLKKLQATFKGEFDDVPMPLNKMYVDDNTKQIIDAINNNPELKKIYTITSHLKSSDLKAITHILEKMS